MRENKWQAARNTDKSPTNGDNAGRLYKVTINHNVPDNIKIR